MTQYPLTNVVASPYLPEALDSDHVGFESHDDRPMELSVVTGQQIGLLGGPLYTLLKIRSAVVAAHNLSKQYNRKVQPVFWLEDNDHDIAEACTTWLAGPDHRVEKVSVVEGGGRIPVHELRITQQQTATLQATIERIDGRFADETKNRYLDVYRENRSWADSFIDILQPYTDAWGVRIIRGSDVIREGAHASLVRVDLESNQLHAAISTATEELRSHGLPIQATVSDALFFLHVNGERMRLVRQTGSFRTTDGQFWSNSELLHILDTEPHRFSPNVLGRPLVQDAVLRPVATVVGAAEYAYHQQLNNAYHQQAIAKPLRILRHHGCILDHKTERTLHKLDLQVADFFTTINALEQRVVQEEAETLIPSVSEELLSNIAEPFVHAAEQIDPTLVKTVQAAKASVVTGFESVASKLRSALRKKHTERIDRIQSVWQWVYPNTTLAERVHPLAVYESRMGIESVRSFVQLICSNSNRNFTVVGPSDLQSSDV